jgi:hypothetical protein
MASRSLNVCLITLCTLVLVPDPHLSAQLRYLPGNQLTASVDTIVLLPDAPDALSISGSNAAEEGEAAPALLSVSDSSSAEPGWTLPAPPPPLVPCDKDAVPGTVSGDRNQSRPCVQINPYRRFLDNTTPIPLTPRQKAYLAFHNFRDPGNIVTITGTAAFTVGTNSHTAYGPGWMGFVRNSGYSFSQDATGEFFGTFLIPSLFHEDPHYHRVPDRTVPHRLVHALSRTFVAQHDDGSPMLNYAVLLTYPISAEMSNLYVPGIHGNAPSTAERIATGLATDPVNNLITEFLPDVARHINVRVIFVQRIVNMMMAGNASVGAGATALDVP